LALALGAYAVPLPLLVTLAWADVLTAPDPEATLEAQVLQHLPKVILDVPGVAQATNSDLTLPPLPSDSPSAAAVPSPSAAVTATPRVTTSNAGVLQAGGGPGFSNFGGNNQAALNVSASAVPCVAAGTAARITVNTRAGASVTISVAYPDGSTNNAGSRSGTADSSGTFLDRWTVSGYASSGSASYSANVSSGDEIVGTGGSFQIYHPANGEKCP
jgi:hypothetical protein